MNLRAVAPAVGRIPFRVGRALVAGAVTALIVGLPTDVIPNPVFGREIPVRWWEYPVLALTVMLTAVWFGVQRAPDDRTGSVPALTGGTLAIFAIGCPVCNKLVIAAVGVSGALGIWEPLQPALAVVSLALLGVAVAYRRRRRECGPGACG